MQKYLHIILLILSLQSLFAQDPVLTQFYAAPILINPAFAGADGNMRLGMGYRNQATKSDDKLRTMYAFGDSWFESINSGIGVSILNQNEELTKYSFLMFSLHYSYHIKISDTWTLFPGISFDMGYKDYRFQGLLFEDQIDISNGIDPVTTDPIYNDLRRNISFIDISAGGILYAPNAWVGFSVKHLTSPNISFTQNENLPLSIHFSVHGGYQLPIFYHYFPEESNLFFTFNYMKQDVYNRLDFGTEIQLNKFSVGFQSSSVIQKIENSSEFLLSLSPVFGLEFNNFKIGFSYDYPISNFSTFGGTSELTLQYFIKNNSVRRSLWQKKY